MVKVGVNNWHSCDTKIEYVKHVFKRSFNGSGQQRFKLCRQCIVLTRITGARAVGGSKRLAITTIAHTPIASRKGHAYIMTFMVCWVEAVVAQYAGVIEATLLATVERLALSDESRAYPQLQVEVAPRRFATVNKFLSVRSHVHREAPFFVVGPCHVVRFEMGEDLFNIAPIVSCGTKERQHDIGLQCIKLRSIKK